MTLPTFIRDECGSCQAPIIWCVTTTGSRAPVDFDPVADGTIAVDHRGTVIPLARVLTVAQRFGRNDLRKSHFATCPEAARHRKRGRA